MFQDSDTEVIGFDSCPESEKLVNDNSSQTVGINITTQATQTIETSSLAVQTTPNATPSSHSYDADKLVKFLKRVMPYLEEELKNSDNININKDMDEDENALQEAPKQTIIQPDFSKGKIISSLSWNSTRMMLAVGCAEKTHDGWCCHETSVGLYNIGKTHFEKQPEQVLKVSGCVKYLEFHERIPSILAGGLHSGECKFAEYNGGKNNQNSSAVEKGAEASLGIMYEQALMKVIIWDLKHDEEVFVVNKKGIDEPAHVDAITTIIWRDIESGQQLVTTGRDGQIILWKVNLANLTYEIQEKYIILKQHLMPGAQITEHLEILQTDFLSPKCPYFLTATSGGVIFYCSLTAARPLPASQIKDPVLKSYKPRKGIVTSISCEKDLFASGGTDFEIQIFKYEQESPILRIHATYAVLGVWWNAPGNLIYWGESKVDSHIIKTGKVVSICDANGISSAAFKTGRKSRLAFGDKIGAVNIITGWAN